MTISTMCATMVLRTKYYIVQNKKVKMSEKAPKSNSENLLNSLEVAGNKPADCFRVNPADYPIFSRQSELSPRWGDNSKTRWNIDKTLNRFVTSTADLIATIDGSSIEYENHPERIRPDHVIYLDKSARPVSWMVNLFWDKFSDEKRPGHSYLNIDRQPWFRRSGVTVNPDGYSRSPDGSLHRDSFSDFKTENIPPEDFARIRALYIDGGIKSENPAEIMESPSQLDGKNILIVDEVKRSGSTLDIAKWLIKNAFPEAASVEGAYFWQGSQKVNHDGTESQMRSVPVWYDSSTTFGRGAGEIDPKFYADRHETFKTDRTRAQKFGSLVLSSTYDLASEPNQLSRELLREMKKMRGDFDAGKILLSAPHNYDFDRAADAIEAQGIKLAPSNDRSPDTFINIQRAIDSRPPDA